MLNLRTSAAATRTMPVACNINSCMRAAATSFASISLQMTLILSPSIAVENSPYDAGNMTFGPTSRGTVLSCPGNVNPNCVSTASTNESYSPAWRADEASIAEAVRVLSNAVMSNESLSNPEFLAQKDLPQEEGAVYIAFTFDPPSGWGPNRDLLEFVIKKDLPPSNVSRVKAADGEATGALVTYRAISGNVRYFYPWTTPLTDFHAQEKRLEEVRKSVGWQRLGCELIECYYNNQSDFSF